MKALDFPPPVALGTLRWTCVSLTPALLSRNSAGSFPGISEQKSGRELV